MRLKSEMLEALASKAQSKEESTGLFLREALAEMKEEIQAQIKSDMDRIKADMGEQFLKLVKVTASVKATVDQRIPLKASSKTSGSTSSSSSDALSHIPSVQDDQVASRSISLDSASALFRVDHSAADWEQWGEDEGANGGATEEKKGL